MSQRIGVCEVWDGSQWLEIDIYRPGSFSNAFVELPTEDGEWGVPYLEDPADADTPIEVYGPDGNWYGISQQGFLLMEGATQHDWYKKWNFSNHRYNYDRTARARWDGDYGIKSAAEPADWMCSVHDDFPYYPQPGDRVEFFVKFPNQSAIDAGVTINLGLQDYPYSDGFDSGSFGEYIQFDIRPPAKQSEDTSTTDIVLSQHDGSSLTEVNHGSFGSLHTNQWYWVFIDWEYTPEEWEGDTDPRETWGHLAELDSDYDTPDTFDGTSQSYDSMSGIGDGNISDEEYAKFRGDHSQGGIAIRSGGDTHIDWLHKKEPL